MSLIITGDGQSTEILSPTSISQEIELQRFIRNNPECLALDDIRDGLEFEVLTREFPTASGPLDILLVDDEGTVYIVETKLYNNSDRRRVLAQMLDYGAALWSEYQYAAHFLETLQKEVRATFDQTLEKYLEDFAERTERDVDGLLDDVTSCISEGDFHFVVLMDRMTQRLKDLIRYVNENSEFDIYGVSLEFYAYDGRKIVLPKLYGAEVQKRVTSTRSRRKKWNESSFFADVRDKLSPEEVNRVRELYDVSRQHADTLRWGTGAVTGSFNAIFEEVHPTKSLYTVQSDGQLWFNFGWLGEGEYAEKVTNKVVSQIETFDGVSVSGNDHIKVEIEAWAPRIKAVKELIREIGRPTD
jgi:hypothetical protein